MIQQRYGNNIPLCIVTATSLPLQERKVAVRVIRRMGRKVPFSFDIDSGIITGTIFGKDQPNREDVLSISIILDEGTETQQIIDIPDVVALTSKTSADTMTPTQMIFIQTNGNRSIIQLLEQPRKKPKSPSASKTATHEQMAETATPDVTLS